MKFFSKVFVCGIAFLGFSMSVFAQSFDAHEKVVALDGAAGDNLGQSVSISGDTAIVGAYRDGGSIGAAYVFKWNGATWDQVAKLTASDGVVGDEFGYSVEISGNVAIVGASKNSTSRGAAYIFRWNGITWEQEAKLLALDGASWHRFGDSVSISGDKALVGAFAQGGYKGAAYVFKWNGSTWFQEAKLVASDGVGGDWFGESVSISGDRLIVGSLQDDDHGNESGSAYIYEWNGTSWTETKLTALDGAVSDYFGDAVSILGDTAVVGASRDDDTGSESGSIYIFTNNGTSWTQTQKRSDGVANNWYGRAVSISDGLLVGAGNHMAHVYKKNGSTWTYLQEVIPTSVNTYWGNAISISGEVLLVGDYNDNTNGANAGAAYFVGTMPPLEAPDTFCSASAIATLTNPIADLIYWDWWDGNSPYLANAAGTAVVAITVPSETVLTTAEITAVDGNAQPGLVYYNEETGTLFVADTNGDLQDPATIASNAVADTAAVAASAKAGEVYFNTTTGDVFYCAVDGTLDNPADPSSTCLTQ